MRFVAGQGALAECHREDVSGQGAAAEHHREAATAGKVRRATAGKERKGVRLPARRDCREQRVGLFF